MTTRPSARTNTRVRFTRNGLDRILGGVAGGIGAALGVGPWWPRLVFVLLGAALPGFGALLYILLWIILPAPALSDLPSVIGTPRPIRPEGALVIGVLTVIAGLVALVAYTGLLRTPQGDLLVPGMLILIAFVLLVRQLRRG